MAVLDDAPAVMRDPPGRVYLSLMLAASGSPAARRAHASPHTLGPATIGCVSTFLVLPRADGVFLGIRAGSERRRWERGRCLLFDDLCS